jgi:hypothetical protein
MVPQFIDRVSSGQWGLAKGVLNTGLTVFVLACVGALLVIAVSRWIAVAAGMVPARTEVVYEDRERAERR